MPKKANKTTTKNTIDTMKERQKYALLKTVAASNPNYPKPSNLPLRFPK
jgi:hypothetical protein